MSSHQQQPPTSWRKARAKLNALLADDGQKNQALFHLERMPLWLRLLWFQIDDESTKANLVYLAKFPLPAYYSFFTDVCYKETKAVSSECCPTCGVTTVDKNRQSGWFCLNNFPEDADAAFAKLAELLPDDCQRTRAVVHLIRKPFWIQALYFFGSDEAIRARFIRLASKPLPVIPFYKSWDSERVVLTPKPYYTGASVNMSISQAEGWKPCTQKANNN